MSINSLLAKRPRLWRGRHNMGDSIKIGNFIFQAVNIQGYLMENWKVHYKFIQILKYTCLKIVTVIKE